ncbi:hypothetical protein [Rickettsia asembonensis]|nr:hypothetical protein [Rickettsia asembonensis]WCR57006.1 MAG: hypothetical protein PG979_001063 [Rickettsia asembonensis]
MSFPQGIARVDTEGRHYERLNVLLHGSKNTLGVIPAKAGIHHKASF